MASSSTIVSTSKSNQDFNDILANIPTNIDTTTCEQYLTILNEHFGLNLQILDRVDDYIDSLGGTIPDNILSLTFCDINKEYRLYDILDKLIGISNKTYYNSDIKVTLNQHITNIKQLLLDFLFGYSNSEDEPPDEDSLLEDLFNVILIATGLSYLFSTFMPSRQVQRGGTVNIYQIPLERQKNIITMCLLIISFLLVILLVEIYNPDINIELEPDPDYQEE